MRHNLPSRNIKYLITKYWNNKNSYQGHNNLSRFKSYWFYIKLFTFASSWYYLGSSDNKDLYIKFYNKGYSVSQKLKIYPWWDKYAEPIIIKQFGCFFIAGHSFIEGMVSDNENREEIDDELYQLKDNIIKKLENIN